MPVQQMHPVQHVCRNIQPGEQATENIVDVLRRASVTLDAMWRAASHRGPTPSAIRLGEASHGVHRALIALRSFADADSEVAAAQRG